MNHKSFVGCIYEDAARLNIHPTRFHHVVVYNLKVFSIRMGPLQNPSRASVCSTPLR
jgi:hypothetical protein